MNENGLAFWMTLTGTICWGFCFWWMRRISIKQNFLLDPALPRTRQADRETFPKIEHDLIKEVHPQVGEIKEGMDEMIAVVKENAENNPASSKRRNGRPPFRLPWIGRIGSGLKTINTRPRECSCERFMAERLGFEPTVHLRTLSRRVHETTQPSLHQAVNVAERTAFFNSKRWPCANAHHR